MASAVEICNIALQLIGDKAITSLSGTDALSIRVNRIWEKCRDKALQADDWRFAMKRAQLDLATVGIYGMVYFPGGDLFVAVGKRGMILTSGDNGVTWERQTSGVGYDLHAVCVVTIGSTSTLVAVGKRGTILTSTDGSTWDAQTSGVTVNLYGVAGYTDHVVACGAVGVILSSTNATTWTSRTSGVSTVLRGATVRSATPLFVVVGDSGVILTSDGSMTTWTAKTSGVSTDLRAVLYGGLYLTVGDAGVILTSTDGTAWTARTSGVTVDLYAALYGGAVYRVVGDDGTLLGSSNGTTWTAISNSETDDLKALAYSTSDQSWIAGGDVDDVLTSEDGSTWESVNLEPTFGFGYSFALPGDYLKFIGARMDEDDADDEENTFAFSIEGGLFLTDQDEVYLRYGARITDTEKFPWWFVDYLAVLIAQDLEPIQAKMASLAQVLEMKRIAAFRTAQSYNGADQYVEDERGKTLWNSIGR